LRPYIGQAVGGELDLMMLIGGAEERAAIQLIKAVKYNTSQSVLLILP
jgi:hypothetical protein